MPKSIKDHVAHEDAKFFHMDFRIDGREKVHGHISFPNTYVKVKSKSDLKELLDYFGHQTAWMTLIPNTTFARKTYVERTRPALRYYCEKYQVDVPEWLASDSMFLNIKPNRKQSLFGKEDLHIVEFKKVKVPPFKTDRHEQQPQQEKE